VTQTLKPWSLVISVPAESCGDRSARVTAHPETTDREAYANALLPNSQVLATEVVQKS